MFVSKEWLLALGTHEVLHVPLLSQSCHHALFNWSPASATDWYTHLVMTSQAIQLTLNFASTRGQLDTTCFAIKVVRVVGFSLESYAKYLLTRM